MSWWRTRTGVPDPERMTCRGPLESGTVSEVQVMSAMAGSVPHVLEPRARLVEHVIALERQPHLSASPENRAAGDLRVDLVVGHAHLDDRGVDQRQAHACSDDPPGPVFACVPGDLHVFGPHADARHAQPAALNDVARVDEAD